MSKSPLSGAFSGSSEPAKKKKKNGAILLIAGIALTSSIGGVFAANSITINGGSNIEFGQGVAATSSCSSALRTAITQVYTADTFRVDDVVVSSIDTSRCSSTTMKVTLLGSTGNSLDTFTITGSSATVTTDRLGVATVNAGDVKKVTVTTE